jgi:hypothetical protein
MLETGQKSFKFIKIQKYMQLDKKKPYIENIRGLNLAAVRPTAIQESYCHFGGVK